MHSTSPPSDVVYAGSWPRELLGQPGLPRALIEGRQRNPLECKEAGNSALAVRHFEAAHASYTEGIQLIVEGFGSYDQRIKQDLYRNRSLMRITLGRYEGAVEDAIASLTHIPDDKHKKLDSKAYFRAASASYGLKLYEKAALFLCDQLALAPGDRDGLTLLSKIQDRLGEQAQGSYDIVNIEKSVSSKLRVDAADFFVNTTVKPSGPNRGRGLFATRDLKPGDLIMTETAFCAVWSHEDDNLIALEGNARSPDEILPNLVGLWRTAVNEAAKNPSKGSEFLGLHGGYKGTGTLVHEADHVAVVDTFKAHDIVACNSFALLPVTTAASGNLQELARGSGGIWI
jgi:hypothetical protein